MSVEVKQLTKIYGSQKAVDEVSFSVPKGQVMGFLGPNGAGKSTTMKMITCYIPKTSGTISVCGIDIETDTIEIRKKIGYLPENNPLYLDMYVKEYLQFVAGIHNLGENKHARIAEMIGITGLSREQHKKIGQLSKGFKQRVGLAQAMLHNPEVLILDEPTSGLDPNQLVEIRSLIKSFGEDKTVILSTHIMQEVEAICDRVVIINEGKIVADDTTENIRSSLKGEVVIRVAFKEQVEESFFKSIEGINNINQKGTEWILTCSIETDVRVALSNAVRENNLTLLTMNQEQLELEDVFQKLTK